MANEVHTVTYIFRVPFLIFLIITITSPSRGLSQSIIVKPYIQMLDSHSVVVMFETDLPAGATVHFGLSPFDLTSQATAISQTGNGQSQIFTSSLQGLSPSTKYYYRVSLSNNQQSLVYHFKTMSNDPESPVHLVAVSDMQMQGSRPNIFRDLINLGIIPVAETQIEGGLEQLHGMLIPGDLVQNGGNYNEWKNTFFDKTHEFSPFVPLYPSLGNHEYYNNGLTNYLKYFTLPLNGSTTYPEQWWYKDFSNVRIIALNSNANATLQAQQISWLQAVTNEACSNDQIDFVFVQLHHPFKSESWTPGELPFTGQVIGILESFTESCNKPSGHFYGHTHGYSRGQSKNHHHLWINVATAGGAIDYWGQFPNQDYSEFNISEDEYGFVLIKAEAGPDPEFTIMRYSRGDDSVPLQNVLSDSITIKKTEYAPNKPVAISPVSENIAIQCVTLKASVFDDPGSFHQGTQWQISTTQSFDSPIKDIWRQHQNVYQNTDLQANDDLTEEWVPGLLPSTTYYWRVRYRDKHLMWSPWSDTVTFTTESLEMTGNLLVNPGAENGINGWGGQIESLTANECGSVPPYLGSRFFAVGGVCSGEQTVGYANQSIDVSNFASVIDEGMYFATFGGYLRAYANNNDKPEIGLECIGEQGNVLLATPFYGNTTNQWQLVDQTISIPPYTRKIKYILKGTRLAGVDNDSYFDELTLRLFASNPCPACFGSGGVDADSDGFCSDIDCDDNDPSVFPGAVEGCDAKDNNCDGITDTGETAEWTGGGGDLNWENPQNWNQGMVPLPCQHVLIYANTVVNLTENAHIRSLVLGPESTLHIGNNGALVMDNASVNTEAALQVSGELLNNGRIDVKNTMQAGVRLTGTLHNLGRVYIKNTASDVLIMETGSNFINDGLWKSIK